jgi:serine/threonine protein phosphatase PrpC
LQRSLLGTTVDYAEETHPGLDPEKQLNEDSCGSSESPFGLLFVLCDGMGGHSAGEVASRKAVATVIERVNAAPPSSDPGKALRAALEAANAAVCELGVGASQHARPGSTCVAVLLSPSGLYAAHVGDSRAYLLRGGQAQRLTRDHSVVAELVAASAITPEQAAAHPNAHQITRALGMQATVAVDVSGPQHLKRGDAVLLCSDGLTDLVADPEIAATLASSQDAAAACQALVRLALGRGGHDNVTVQILRVLDATDSAPTVVDTLLEPLADSHPSATSGSGAEAPPTLLDLGTTLHEPSGLGETPPMTERLKVAPTMVDHPSHPDRATPIAPFPPPGAFGPTPLPPPTPVSNPRPPSSLPPDAPARRGSAMLVMSLGVVGIIVIFVLIWWVAGGGRR